MVSYSSSLQALLTVFLLLLHMLTGQDLCNVEAVPINEHLQPGGKLPNEAHLAKELNIGRSSLREAMKLLASRNIVTIRQGSGTYVASSPGVVDDPLGFTFIPDKKACPGSA